jgi:N-acetylglucosaminyl-diphospho-decaprenol L-rhamnosyltransferase
VGGIDEGVFAYNEDFDLALRLRIAGWKAAVAHDAVGIHIGSATHGHRSAWQRYHGGFGRGYVLRRYGVLRSRAAARALATESAVAVGDMLISRDAAALRGRIQGWRAARTKPRLPIPPADSVDEDITLLDSLRLRRGVYSGEPPRLSWERS